MGMGTEILPTPDSVTLLVYVELCALSEVWLAMIQCALLLHIATLSHIVSRVPSLLDLLGLVP